MNTIYSVPAQDNFLQRIAKHLLQQLADSTADLSHVHVFIPNALAAQQLRQQLCQCAKGTVMGPSIDSMSQWINSQIPLQHTKQQLINQHARQLLLLEALDQHPDLFNAQNTWQVCDSLLNLFDELTQQDNPLLNGKIDDWTEQLKQAYGPQQRDLPPLSHEAKIVHTLWQAWQQQLQARGIADAANAYQQRLANTEHPITPGQHFIIIGPEQLSGAEINWCEQLSTQHRVDYFIQGQVDGFDDAITLESHPPPDLHRFIELAYDQSTDLAQRSQLLKTQGAMPVDLQALRVAKASSAEQEAQGIEIKIRQWLIDGKQSIAVITEDRKLARRIRALLERADIAIQDTAGWSLSTTSAAAAVERWLECIEEDFAHQPLLDLLKSPFYCDADRRQQHLIDIYRLEQDIIFHENIPRDISRYQKALAHRQDRLPHWSSHTAVNLKQLLGKLAEAAKDLRGLYTSNQSHAPQVFLHSLSQSLEALGINPQLNHDSAGLCLLQEIEQMQLGLQQASPAMGWNDFRVWLGSSLETAQFKPQNLPAVVQMMNMQQAQYCQFDALIIAGASKTSLPGSSQQSAFFNQSVKQSLGLKSWPQEKQYSFYRFRSLLESADSVLLSYTAETNGEWIQASPWLTSLLDFAQLSYQLDLHDQSLKWLVETLGYITECDSDIRPTTPQQPAPALDPELSPREYSASRYQRLINCPYQFFAADGLGLKPNEQISEELRKSEYGEKVHLVLYAFHHPVKSLPAPFKQALTKDNRDRALKHIIELSKQVFEQDMEDNVQHRGWLQRWLQTAPAYIDWQISRQQLWHIDRLEQQLETSLDPQTQVKGRLDRIDKQAENFSVIDYKTGNPPSQKNIDSGEDVQLATYASLVEPINQLAYLKLDKGEVKIASQLDNEKLQELQQLNWQRLQQLVSEIDQGQGLPAWGDDNSCQYCQMAGMCRKQVWDNA